MGCRHLSHLPSGKCLGCGEQHVPLPDYMEGDDEAFTTAYLTEDAQPMSKDPTPDAVETMTSAAQAKRMLLGFEIPRDELALRIAIPCLGMRPRDGMDATTALDMLAASQPEIIKGFRAAADQAVLYFHECINAGAQPS